MRADVLSSMRAAHTDCRVWTRHHAPHTTHHTLRTTHYLLSALRCEFFDFGTDQALEVLEAGG